MPKDVNQGRVSIGLLTVKRDSPDIYALEVMNEILGGSGFTSRITKTVRSNEGLAYSAGSGISFGAYYPGRFRAGFQSKSESVALATQLVLEEIKKIREAPVTDEELDTIKRNLIETFPSSFASKAQAMGIFAADEYTKRDPAFWATYRDRIKAVTAGRRAARGPAAPGAGEADPAGGGQPGRHRQGRRQDQREPRVARPRRQGARTCPPRPDDHEAEVAEAEVATSGRRRRTPSGAAGCCS